VLERRCMEDKNTACIYSSYGSVGLHLNLGFSASAAAVYIIVKLLTGYTVLDDDDLLKMLCERYYVFMVYGVSYLVIP
jgi:hypothetical protein